MAQGWAGGRNWRSAAGDDGTISNDTGDADTVAYDQTTVAIGAASTPVVVTVTINDAADLTNGETVTLDRGLATEEDVVISNVTATTFDCVTTEDHLVVGTDVEEGRTFSTTAGVGYPLIPLPTGDVVGIQPSSIITFDDTTETDSATVLGAYINIPVLGSGVVINDILEDSSASRYTFGPGSTFVNDSSRVPDALQVNLIDRSSNDSSDTDADGDGIADFDQIGYEEVDDPLGFHMF